MSEPQNNFIRYYDQLARTKSIVEAREERLHAIVRQVLEGNGIYVKRIGIKDVDIYGERVRVTFGWTSRGHYDEDDVFLPLYLFTSDDPKAAAIAYREEVEREKKESERKQKLAQFNALASELGKNAG